MPNQIYRRSAAGTWILVGNLDDIAVLASMPALRFGVGAPPAFPATIDGLVPKNGDFYLDTGTLAWYRANAGAWAVMSLTIADPATLSFGSTTRQMINLWGTSYGIGIQAATMYFRANSRFAWFRNGVHSNTTYDPGAGGALSMVLDDGGRLLVGKSASDGAAEGAEMHPNGTNVCVVGATSGTAANQFLNHISSRDSNGSMFVNFSRGAGATNIGSVTQVNTTGVAFNTTSDGRLKTVLHPVLNALERLNELNPVRFQWNGTDYTEDGFIAQEVAPIVPDAVTGEPDDVDEHGNIIPMAMDKSRLIPLLVAAVQELSAEVQSLRTELHELKGQS